MTNRLLNTERKRERGKNETRMKIEFAIEAALTPNQKQDIHVYSTVARGLRFRGTDFHPTRIALVYKLLQ